MTRFFLLTLAKQEGRYFLVVVLECNLFGEPEALTGMYPIHKIQQAEQEALLLALL